MRYEPATRLLRLAVLLSGSHSGLTLDEMAERLEVTRRTVERLRDRLEEVFPQLWYEADDGRVRRWRLPRQSGVTLPPPRTAAIAAVETLARDLARAGDHARAALLQEAAAHLKAMLPADHLRRAEPDIEALMAAEGVAARPGPRLKLDPALMAVFRDAIVGMRKLAVRYRSATAPRAQRRILLPYGVLYGPRAYLVAEAEGKEEMRLWRIDRITAPEPTAEAFSPHPFDLAASAARSFGVYQEEPFEVALRFAPEAAEEAGAWLFHPTQRVERAADGALLVRFRAGGRLELCWHLFTWGDRVRILAPAALRAEMAVLCRAVVGVCAPSPGRAAAPRDQASSEPGP